MSENERRRDGHVERGSPPVSLETVSSGKDIDEIGESVDGDDTSTYGIALKRSFIVRSGIATCSWSTTIRSTESHAMAAV